MKPKAVPPRSAHVTICVVSQLVCRFRASFSVAVSSCYIDTPRHTQKYSDGCVHLCNKAYKRVAEALTWNACKLAPLNPKSSTSTAYTGTLSRMPETRPLSLKAAMNRESFPAIHVSVHQHKSQANKARMHTVELCRTEELTVEPVQILRCQPTSQI